MQGDVEGCQRIGGDPPGELGGCGNAAGWQVVVLPATALLG
jgi:hypothetical protein